MSSLLGQVLGDTYRIDRLLGEGGMGAVYAASHLRLPTRVAVKVLHPGIASPEVFVRFRREAEITSSLRHPNIVKVLDFNWLGDTPYLIMEFLEGEDLNARLNRRGRLSLAETLAVAEAVGAGLGAAHRRGVVHRDMKPHNLFLCAHEGASGEGALETLKILDFGISKIRHAEADPARTRAQQLLGTPHFMSPEQARGDNDHVDPRTDQWALAAILYRCLTGALPFSGNDLAGILYQVLLVDPPAPSQLVAGLPAHIDRALRRALSKDRDARFPSIGEFVQALTSAATPAVRATEVLAQAPAQERGGRSGTLTGAGGQVAPQVAPPAPRRRRLILAGLGAAVGLAAVGLGVAQRGRPMVQPTGSIAHAAAIEPRSAAQAVVVSEPAPATVLLHIQAEPAGASVILDGRPVPGGELRVPRDAASRRFLIRAPGHAAQEVVLAADQDQRVVVRLAALPAADPTPALDRDRDKDKRPPSRRRSVKASRAEVPMDDVDLSGLK